MLTLHTDWPIVRIEYVTYQLSYPLAFFVHAIIIHADGFLLKDLNVLGIVVPLTAPIEDENYIRVFEYLQLCL